MGKKLSETPLQETRALVNLDSSHIASQNAASDSGRLPHWLLAIVVLLNIAWPMMHSIAARNTLLALLLLASTLLLRCARIQPLLPGTLAKPAKLFLLLSGWLLATVLLADEPLNSLSQYRGEWLMGSLALTAGLLCAQLARHRAPAGLTPTGLLAALTLALAVPGLMAIGNALPELWHTHTLPAWNTPLYDRTAASLVTNTLYGMLLADGLGRSGGKPRLLPLPGWALATAMLLTLAATYMLNTRNGTICLLLLTLFGFGIFVWQRRQHAGKPALLLAGLSLLAALAWFGSISYQADPRWAAFNESVQISLDTEHHRAWLDDKLPLPLMQNGQHVDHSAYMRLAWFKEGMLAIRDFPLGVGFGRNAFGHALQRKYGQGSGHSHSSLIDFTLSGGIPGLLLWLGFSTLLLHFGWQAFFRAGNPAGLALALLIVGTLLRMTIDSNLRDHGLEQYLFLLATLAVLSCPASAPQHEGKP